MVEWRQRGLKIRFIRFYFQREVSKVHADFRSFKPIEIQKYKIILRSNTSSLLCGIGKYYCESMTIQFDIEYIRLDVLHTPPSLLIKNDAIRLE